MNTYKKLRPYLWAVLIALAVSLAPVTIWADGNMDAEAVNSEMTEESDAVDADAIDQELQDAFNQEGAADEGDPEGLLDEGEKLDITYSRARVIKIINEEDLNIESSGGAFNFPRQILEVKVLKGPHQGETLQAEYGLNYGFENEYKMSKLGAGDDVFLYIDENSDGTIEAVHVTEVARDKYLLYLMIAFVIALVVIGRSKGVKAVISLGITAFAVIKILLPAILKGMDPVWTSVAVCSGVIAATMLIISGFNRKTISSIIGTIGGVIVAGIVAMIVGSMAKLTGIGGDESQMLMYIPQDVHFDFKGLLFAGILIVTMCANMDVGMSIASAMHEIRTHNPEISSKKLRKAGMNVGRDIMATMSNTLILAYAGGSLHLMLLLMAYQTPFSELINWDIIASEVLRAVAGSMGLIFTIPITAYVASAIERKKHEKVDEGVLEECDVKE